MVWNRSESTQNNPDIADAPPDRGSANACPRETLCALATYKRYTQNTHTTCHRDGGMRWTSATSCRPPSPASTKNSGSLHSTLQPLPYARRLLPLLAASEWHPPSQRWDESTSLEVCCLLFAHCEVPEVSQLWRRQLIILIFKKLKIKF